MIGCDCCVCTSTDPHNSRTRTSAFIEVDDVNLIIDTGPEFRLQVIREHIRRVDAVLFTHAHADHMFGLDDVRRYNDISGKSMPCYGLPDTLSTIKQAFKYVFMPTQIGGGKPSLDLIPVYGPFEINNVQVIPIPINHGQLNILGYRVGNLAYVTDCSKIPESSINLLRGLEVLVLGVLRPEPHETHFSLSQGLSIVEQLKPKHAYFTHIAHKMDHETINRALPNNIELAYDGLQIEI